MSQIGKMLVVVQLVASVVLMIFAGAVASAQLNWRNKATDVAKQLDTAKKDSASLRAEYDKHKSDSEAALTTEKTRGDTLQNNVVTLQAQVDDMKRREQAQLNLAEARGEAADVAVTDNQARRDEVLVLRELYEKALTAKDEEFKLKTQAEDKVFALTVQLTKLREEMTTMVKENSRYKDILLANNLPTTIKEWERKASPPPENVYGKVLSVKKPQSGSGLLVEISIGSDDGLQARHQLYVFRGPEYLGKIQIVHTDPDKAVGTLLQSTKNGIIQEGDNVTTKL